MAKVMTFVMFIVGLFGILTVLGIEGSTSSQLLQALAFGNPENLRTFDLFALVFGSAAGIIATISAVGGIIVGVFRSYTPIPFILASFTSLVAGWIIGDFVSLMLYINTVAGDATWVSAPIKIILIMLISGAIIALVSWWQGGDN